MGSLHPSFLLFREKSRSVRLLVCKRTHDGSQSLSTFHEYTCGARYLFWTADPRRIKVRFIPFRFFISIKNQSHAPSFLLFREKSRSVRLFVCKRTCDGSLSLSTFHRCPKAQRCFFGQFSQITVNQMDCRIFIYKI